MISYCSGVEIAYICLVKESEATHTGEKSHEFNVSGNRFALSSNLKQRMNTHTGEKLHECALFGRTFMGVKTTHADIYRREAL